MKIQIYIYIYIYIHAKIDVKMAVQKIDLSKQSDATKKPGMRLSKRHPHLDSSTIFLAAVLVWGHTMGSVAYLRVNKILNAN